ncbi:hypothetical protein CAUPRSCDRAFT_11805 [Caulochytrium protostelioides]|uniref:Uncharacterized protein n=1 Tax=Caulochytrium protostelioides TaxID=1555241 RepID=A0A4P9WV69_9FUNG|nr:hypothetical protein CAUPRSCDRAFT_11805 [Caulochytrium protostelioides]
MQMNIRGLGLLPFLPLASLMCGVVTAAPPGLEHPFQSVDVPPSNVGTTDNTALPSLAVVEARYSAALQRVEAETPESQLLTYGQFFDYIMKPFHTVHSEIGRGNVVLGDEYRFWLTHLSHITRAPELENIRQEFHKGLATAELLWLYIASSLRYHSSDPRPVNYKGVQVEWSVYKGSALTSKLDNMQKCFKHLVTIETVVRDLLYGMYGDTPAADQPKQHESMKILLQKVLVHLSSKTSMNLLQRHDGDVPDLSIFNQALDWISVVPGLKYGPDRNEVTHGDYSSITEIPNKAGLETMMTTLQSLLGPMIGPKLQDRDAALTRTGGLND